MAEQDKKVKIISIWTWVGLVLGVYGLIITSLGVYYVFVPDTKTATGVYNPSLWWGLIMLLAAAIFLISSRFSKDSGET